jgi:hypothetical protein
MVFNDAMVYGYGRKPEYYRWTTPLEYHLFAADKRPQSVTTTSRRTDGDRRGRRSKERPEPEPRRGGVGGLPTRRIEFRWTTDIPILARAMVLADTTLFVAGPPDLIDENRTLSLFNSPETQEQLARQAAALAGAEGALLWAVSTDGRRLAEHKLDSVPVWDGMAAALGRVYLSTTNGEIHCLGR